MKTVMFARAGNLSVGDHLDEMHSWLAARRIVPRELSMVHVLNRQVVFRAAFETADDADAFVEIFGVGPSA